MTQIDIPALLTQRATLKAEQARLTDAIKAIDAAIKDAHPDAGTYGDSKIVWQKGRISWKKVETDFPKTEFPQLYTSFNSKEAENQIAPAILAQYRGEETLMIK